MLFINSVSLSDLRDTFVPMFLSLFFSEKGGWMMEDSSSEREPLWDDKSSCWLFVVGKSRERASRVRFAHEKNGDARSEPRMTGREEACHPVMNLYGTPFLYTGSHLFSLSLSPLLVSLTRNLDAQRRNEQRLFAPPSDAPGRPQ